ncbi:toll-like receptor 21 [Cheilinus undulatus]|uniref:toll-like receptor 21 n=1 Tax=Cheilinus undulatus TaxID=241271 RepID=UPI001BD501C6|nr:toll-like receptor 21 [Cheilinus undulatus]
MLFKGPPLLLKNMERLIPLLLSTVVFLAAVEPISFRNCIKDPNSNETFKCIHRNNMSISAYVDDLPKSTINLIINNTTLRNIPKSSFVHLPNLRELRLDNNNLSNIDPFSFQNLHRLRSLNLSTNKILVLRPHLFHDLHNLTFLSLANNRLKQLPEGIFSSLYNLAILIMRQNFLTNFSTIAKSVSNLTRLTSLDLCFNRFTSLSHANASLPKSLTRLYLCRNNLSTLGCKQSFLSVIKLLDLSYNPELSTVAFHGIDLSHINYLRLRSTQVKVVEFLKTSSVNPSHVDFSGTGLKNDTLLVELCKFLKQKVKWVKNMTLSSNEIVKLTKNTLRDCPNIRLALDLSLNKLKNTDCLNFLNRKSHLKVFTAEFNYLTYLPTCKVQNMNYFSSVEEISYRYNRILLVNSHAFANTPNLKTLKLNINKIAYLNVTAFKGLQSLETLRLDNNLLTELFKGTFEDQVNLKTLNLRNNRIAAIFDETFHSLKNLTILDLGGNKITHFTSSGLDGLWSLSKFYLDGNNLKKIDASLYHAFQDTLTVLDLQSNQIHFIKEQTFSPFKNLSKLLDLKLDGQRPHGLGVMQRKFFHGLSSLQSLYLTDNKIYQLSSDVFDDLRSLKFLTLDNCCVGVMQLQPGVFKNQKNLTKLIIESMVIQNFSREVFGQLTQLEILQLNRNGMHSIPVDALESIPKLKYLDIRSIPLTCTCTNSLLQNWTVNNPRVQVVYLYNLPCQHDPKHFFYNFDTKVCYIDLGEYLFLSTAVVIFLFTFTPLLYVKLYWKMKYSYYVFRSWFSEQWHRIRDEEENCKYDAFISYNSSDEQWVMDQLLPNLEGNGSSFRLCLHHRDFEPGRYIVDNIVTAVYSSRKTICVVSRNFLSSEWCSLEIQLASYRLFDEHWDVLLLVFLEPISERQLSSYHRMRKVMLKKTYLQWPSSNCTDPIQAQELFWNQLRRAMRTGSRVEMEESDKRKGCATFERERTEDFGTNMPDENLYLVP